MVPSPHGLTDLLADRSPQPPGCAAGIRSQLLTLEKSMRHAMVIGVGVGVAMLWLVTSNLGTTYCRFEDRRTERAARTVRQATLAWLARNPGRECPGVQNLRASDELDPQAEVVDEWGHPLRIACSGADVTVRSPGPDGHRGTRDDIVIPKEATQ